MSDQTPARAKSLLQILHGSAFFIVGKVIRDGAGFLFNLVLVQAIGLTAYGVYGYANAIVMLSVGIAKVGGDQALLKLLPERDKSERPALLGSVFSVMLVSSLAVVGVLWGLSPLIDAQVLQSESLLLVLRILLFIIPMYALSETLAGVFRSLGQAKYDVLIRFVLLPISRLVAALFALLAGITLNGFLLTFIVALSVTSFAIIMLYLNSGVPRPSSKFSRVTIHELLDFSLPVALSQVGSRIAKRLDILFVGVFFGSTIVGAYNIAALLSTVVLIPLTALNQLFPPVAAGLYDSDDHATLSQTYATVTRWSTAGCLLLTIGSIVFRRELLELFNVPPDVGALVLTLLIAGQFINAAAGPSNYLLLMTGHQYIGSVNNVVFAALNGILNYVLLVNIGYIGAAAATALSIALLNATRVTELWLFENLVPYSTSFVKLLPAGGIATLVMIGARQLTPGLPSIALGGMTGTAAFLLVVYLLGIEDPDREVLTQLIDR